MREAIESIISWRESPEFPLPKEETILIAVESTHNNGTYGEGNFRKVYPAYIGADGEICECADWKPWPGISTNRLSGAPWVITRWAYFPEYPNAD